MNGFITIMWRELTRRRSDYLVAAVAGVLPFTIRFLPGFGRAEEGLIQLLALQLAMILAAVLTVSIGASLFSRDLYEGRLGFYFSRPVSAFALWGGKMTAAYLQLLMVILLVVAPSLLESGQASPLLLGRYGSLLLASALCLPLYLLALSHAVATLLRSRSAWMVLPLAAWMIFSIAGRLIVEDPPYFHEGQWTSFPLFVSFVLSVASLLVAGFLQVQLGRTDLQRGAKVLAIAWSVGMVVSSLISSLVSAGYAHQVL